MIRLRSRIWDLSERIEERLAYYPRWRRFSRRFLGGPKHRPRVMLFFGTSDTPDPRNDFRELRNPVRGFTFPWYNAACGCGWDSWHRDEGSAFRAAKEHSPHVRPDLLRAIEDAEP
jgi:hypothetical protein